MTRVRPTAAAGVAAKRDDAAVEVLFVLGAARSGTTLLYKALCLHPAAAFASNWVARFPRLPLLAAGNRLARRAPAFRRRVWFTDGSQAYVYGRRRRLLERAFPMPVEAEPVYAAAGVPRRPEPGFASADAERRLRRAFGAIARAGGGSVMVTKRIANNARIPFLARAFPAARFVVIERDGRAVARSLSSVDWWADAPLPWLGATPREWAARGGDPWEVCARNWVEDVRQIDEGLAAVPRDHVRVVRYDDLVAEPVQTLAAVAAFAGLGASAEWDRALAELSFPDGDRTWRTALPNDVVAAITEIQRDALVAHGFAV